MKEHPMVTVVRGICWELALAAVVWLLAPAPESLVALASNPQQYVDRNGADDAAMLVAATLLCGVCLLVAPAVLLAVVAEHSRSQIRVVLPISWLRRIAAVMLGLAVLPAAACGPLQKDAETSAVSEVPAAPPTVIDQFDWPAAGQSPSAPATGQSAPESTQPAPATATGPGAEGTPGSAYAVVHGDCLWNIAAALLGPGASVGEIASTVDQLWALNETVIGDDPDHLRPGQVLQLPLTNQPA